MTQISDSDREVGAPFWPGMAVIAATIAFVAVLGWRVLSQHARFGTQSFDLGIFDQGLWLLSRGEDPFVTLRGLPLFGDHSSYIMVLLTPLYWIWPDVRMLLGFVVVVMAVGGPITYLAARTVGIRAWVAAALGIGFLLYPAVAWTVQKNFHPEIVAVPLIIGAYLLAQRGRTRWAVVALALVLTVKEDAPFVIVPLALWMGWKRLLSRRTAWWLAAVAMVVFVVQFAWLLPAWSPSGNLIYTSRYAAYGSDLVGIIWGVLTSPLQLVTDLTSDRSVLYLGGMLIPMWVSLRAADVLAIGLPITVVNLLTTHGYQAEIEFHYTVYLTAIVMIAAVEGARRVTIRPALLGLLVAVTALVAAIGLGPWSITSPSVWTGTGDSPEVVRAAISMIPDDGSVSADWYVAPHLAHRTHIYMWPNPFINLNYGVGGSTAEIAQPEWVLLRDGIGDNFVDEWLATWGDVYDIQFEAKGLRLFRMVADLRERPSEG